MNKRFERILKELNLTPAKFSKKTGISEQTISAQRKNDSHPSPKNLDLIRKNIPEINIEYWIEGIGEPLRDANMMVNEPTINYETEDVHRYIERLQDEIHELRKRVDEKRMLLAMLRAIDPDVNPEK